MTNVTNQLTCMSYDAQFLFGRVPALTQNPERLLEAVWEELKCFPVWHFLRKRFILHFFVV